eukprot:GFUD01043237.1.p1 GENE.GFUD01043237.1~~GFUD01043237.1.p1  ORF type:complete len:254 (+),score=67.65 GFUD01043237.1:71-832(+)
MSEQLHAEEVEKVTRLRQTIVYTCYVEVDQQMVGKLIGKSGEKIKALANETGARIRVIGDRGEQLVRIMGVEENVKAARDKVVQMTQSNKIKVDANMAGKMTKSNKIKVDANMAGKIIGKSGAKIRALQDETGASVKVVKNGDETMVEIIGSDENVQAAQMKVKEIIAGWITKEVKLSSEDTRLIVGKSGKNIKTLEQVTGTRLHMEEIKLERSYQIMKISGPREKVNNAGLKVREFTANQVQMEMLVSKKIC